jgi:Tol biopolymer transport system component
MCGLLSETKRQPPSRAAVRQSAPHEHRSRDARGQDASRARDISTRKNANEGVWGFAWTPEGRLIYSAIVNRETEIWMTDASGGDAKMLTEDVAARSLQVAPDGRYLVFVSYRSGVAQVWRTDADGGNAKQLTDGAKGVEMLAVSPDGRSVIYVLYSGEVWKVSIDGGAPVKLSDGDYTEPRFSPDGKTLALLAFNEQKREQIKLFAFSENGLGAPLKTFDLPVTAQFFYHWSPDGRALVFLNTAGGVSNLWRQPLDGGAPKQFTDFKAERIWNFDYSRDGRQLALARGDSTTDAVLISDEGK